MSVLYPLHLFQVGANASCSYLEANYLGLPPTPFKELVLEEGLIKICNLVVPEITHTWKIDSNYCLGVAFIALGVGLKSRSIILKNVGCQMFRQLVSREIIKKYWTKESSTNEHFLGIILFVALDSLSPTSFGNRYPQQPVFSRRLFPIFHTIVMLFAVKRYAPSNFCITAVSPLFACATTFLVCRVAGRSFNQLPIIYISNAFFHHVFLKIHEKNKKTYDI